MTNKRKDVGAPRPQPRTVWWHLVKWTEWGREEGLKGTWLVGQWGPVTLRGVWGGQLS